MKNEVNKVLHVIGSMNMGGAETLLMNMFRVTNRSKLSYDFLCFNPDKNYDYSDEIYELGGVIHKISGPNDLFKHIIDLYKFITYNEQYRIIHIHHMFYSGIFIFFVRMINSSIKFITHSHSTKDLKHSNLIFRKIYLKVSRLLINKLATERIACGKDAGEFLYGKRKKFRVVNNGLNIDKYLKIEPNSNSNKYHDCFNISNKTIVIGHVGSFRKVKNHQFMIDLAFKLKLKGVDFKLILVGNGDLEKEIKRLVHDKNISDKVLFLGKRSDIPNLMSFFDIFILPSLFEGLPLTPIEAQASKTMSFLSDKITNECDLGLGLTKFISLGDLDSWVEEIENHRILYINDELVRSQFKKNGYDIVHSVDYLTQIYNELNN